MSIEFVALTIFPLTGTPNDCIVDGPRAIIAEWVSLKSAGFKTVDAILPNLLNSEQAYFFRGGQYVLVHVQQDEFLLFALSRNLPVVELTYLFRAKQRLHRGWPKADLAMLEGRRIREDRDDPAESFELKRGLHILKGRICSDQHQMQYVCYVESSDEN